MSGDNGGYIAAGLGAIATGMGALATYLAAKLGIIQKRSVAAEASQRLAVETEIKARADLIHGYGELSGNLSEQIDALTRRLAERDATIEQLRQRNFDLAWQNSKLMAEVATLEARGNDG